MIFRVVLAIFLKVLSCEWLQDRRDCVVDFGGCTQASVDVVGCLPRCSEETDGATLRPRNNRGDDRSSLVQPLTYLIGAMQSLSPT